MAIRLLVNGAKGKMGQLALKTLAEHSEFEILRGTNREDNLALEIAKQKAEIVLDFTNSRSVLNNAKTIIAQGAHPVIGTTGLLKNEIDLLQAECDKLQLGGVIAPNFSLGAILLMKAAAEMVNFFPAVEIIEMHHAGKLDSPSGTALHTAELIAKARKNLPSLPEHTHDTIPHSRGASHHQIPIHAVRLPGLIAHETVIFGNAGETLTLRHDATDRQCFMPGVVLACQKVIHLKKLVYGLENIL